MLGGRAVVQSVQRLTSWANRRVSCAAGSAHTPVWTGETWIMVLRGAVSQWKRAWDGTSFTSQVARSELALQWEAKTRHWFH